MDKGRTHLSASAIQTMIAGGIDNVSASLRVASKTTRAATFVNATASGRSCGATRDSDLLDESVSKIDQSTGLIGNADNEIV